MSVAARSLEATWPGQIRALPAKITDRAGRFRRTRARLACIGVPVGFQDSATSPDLYF